MSGRPVRLLLIAPYPVYPSWSGGKIRIVSLARGLARNGVDVTVLTPYITKQRSAMPADEPFKLKQFAYPFVLPALLTDKPFPYSYLCSFHPGLSLLIKKNLHQYDIIHIEQIQLAGLLDVIPPGIPVVHGSQNVDYDYVRDECRAAWVWQLIRKRIRTLEARLVRQSDHVMAVCDNDRNRLASLYQVPRDKITVIQNGIRKIQSLGSDSSALMQRLPPTRRFPLRVFFSGSDLEHNRIVVRFLIENLAPMRPDIGIVIHGSCGKKFMSQSVPNNIIFDPLDANFADHAVPGTIAINPMVSGSGTNLKFINYLSHGMPVISSPFGMRGFEQFSDCVIICKPEQIADLIGRVPMPSAPDPQRLAGWTWDALSVDALSIYQSLIAKAAIAERTR